MYLEPNSGGIKATLWTSLRRIVGAPIAFLYGIVMGFRNFAYNIGLLKTVRMPVKVVSIGNLSVGGTGKTPTAEMLIRHYLDRGFRPAYLSRGYGRLSKGYVSVDPDKVDPNSVGDEAMQVKLKFPEVPVAVCEDRVAGATQLLEESAFDVLILDDAFQHRRIHRDLDILTLDATRPPWKDYLLPVGRLREGLSSLKRANLVLVNKIVEYGEAREFRKHLPKAEMAFTKNKSVVLKPFNPAMPQLTSEDVRNRAAVVFAGLANNTQFYEAVTGMGMQIGRFYDFPDHYQFREKDMKRVLRRYNTLAKSETFINNSIIVTTEKDYTRLRFCHWFKEEFLQVPFYFIEIELEVIKGKEKLVETLDKVVGIIPESRRRSKPKDKPAPVEIRQGVYF